MPITIACVCGKTLRVKDEFAGRRIRCPACGQITEPPPAEPVFEAVEEATEPDASSPPVTRLWARPVASPANRDSQRPNKPNRDEENRYALDDRASVKPRRKPQRDDDENEDARPRRKPRRDEDKDDRPRRRPARGRAVQSSGGGNELKRVGYLLGGFALIVLGIALLVFGWYGEGRNASKALVLGGCLVFCGFGSGVRGVTGDFDTDGIGGDETGGGGGSDGAGGALTGRQPYNSGGERGAVRDQSG